MTADSRADFVTRTLSAAVLAPAAIAAAAAGGMVFAVFVGLGATLVAIEWARLIGPLASVPARDAGILGVLVALAAALILDLRHAVLVIALAAGVAAAIARAGGRSPAWAALPIGYAGLPAVALIALRGDGDLGFAAVMWLLAAVWAADFAAFALGRLIGGPRLAPRLSPNKTWAGAIAAVAGAGVVGLATAALLGDTSPSGLVLASAMVGVAAVVGDLVESALKRRFGAKDTGGLIPGHGGVMDRIDSLVAAAAVAVVLGLARAGVDAPAEGVLKW